MTFSIQIGIFNACLAFALMMLAKEPGNEVFTPLRDRNEMLKWNEGILMGARSEELKHSANLPHQNILRRLKFCHVHLGLEPLLLYARATHAGLM